MLILKKMFLSNLGYQWHLISLLSAALNVKIIPV
jgi:hypothetical protein